MDGCGVIVISGCWFVGIRKIVLKSKINYQLSMYAIDIQNK